MVMRRNNDNDGAITQKQWCDGATFHCRRHRIIALSRHRHRTFIIALSTQNSTVRRCDSELYVARSGFHTEAQDFRKLVVYMSITALTFSRVHNDGLPVL